MSRDRPLTARDTCVWWSCVYAFCFCVSFRKLLFFFKSYVRDTLWMYLGIFHFVNNCGHFFIYCAIDSLFRVEVKAIVCRNWNQCSNRSDVLFCTFLLYINVHIGYIYMYRQATNIDVHVLVHTICSGSKPKKHMYLKLVF